MRWLVVGHLLLSRLEQALLAGGILGLAALTVTNVVSRSFLGFSIASAEELCQFGLIWITFVGLSHASAQGRHIRMTAFYDALATDTRRKLRLAICLITAGLLLFLGSYAASYVATVRALGTVSPALQLPLWLVYIAAPLGLLMASIHYLAAAWANWKSDGQALIAIGIPDLPSLPTEEM